MIVLVKYFIGLAQSASEASQYSRSADINLNTLFHIRLQIARLVREFNGQIAKILIIGTKYRLFVSYCQNSF